MWRGIVVLGRRISTTFARWRRGVVGTLVAVALTWPVVAGCAPPASSGPPASGQDGVAPAPPLPTSAPQLQNAYEAVVARVLPSVVQITTEQGLGSGVIYDSHGDIVTNAHVVGDAQHFNVRLASSPTSIPASLVGAYPPDDLAVIKLDTTPAGLTPARFGNSAQLRIGAIVLAVGNPLGLSGSVTEGIISATGRTVNEPAAPTSAGATLPDVLQTSAAINPGNSGGALVDLTGQVVGIPTLAALDAQLGGAAPGIGFAIPANLVTDIAGQIVTHGKVVNSHRAALGVSVVSVLDPTGQPLGAGITAVEPDGPAAAAGLTPGAIITALDNAPIRTDADLTTTLATHQPGQHVTVTLTELSTGATRTLTVTLGQLPGS